MGKNIDISKVIWCYAYSSKQSYYVPAGSEASLAMGLGLSIDFLLWSEHLIQLGNGSFHITVLSLLYQWAYHAWQVGVIAYRV